MHVLGMVRNRSQLNINIQSELLEKLKVASIKSGKTITEYVSESITNQIENSFPDNLDSRLLLIEERLGLIDDKYRSSSEDQKIMPLAADEIDH